MRSRYLGALPARQLVSLLPAALAVATLACRENADSPTGPASGSALAATTATGLIFRQVSTGAFHSCGVTATDEAYCWGGNSSGAVGDGSRTHRLTPVAVAGGLRFRHVSVGYEHSCGITLDNRAFCWGQNFFGQLGNGTQGSDHFQVETPAEVAGGRHFKQVRAGYSHTCAIAVSNEAFCWGENIYGQLGDGTTVGEATPERGRATPVRVLGGLEWKQLSGGAEHTCGVTKDDQVYCWGWNAHGQLGDGTKNDRLRPVSVARGLHVLQVEAGAEHSCAVATTHQAFCWGRNYQGVLGDGTTADRAKPAKVATTRRFSNLSAGAVHTCGVTLAEGTLCWGANDSGEIGDGTLASRPTPVAVAGRIKFSMVSSGLVHTCAVALGGQAYCWGAGGGRLGDPANLPRRLTPFPVSNPM